MRSPDKGHAQAWCYDPDYLFFFYLIISDSFFLTNTVEQYLLAFQKNNRLPPFSSHLIVPISPIIPALYCSPFSHCSHLV